MSTNLSDDVLEMHTPGLGLADASGNGGGSDGGSGEDRHVCLYDRNYLCSRRSGPTSELNVKSCRTMAYRYT